MDKDIYNVIEKYIDAYNNFDIEGMLSLLADDVVFENISNNTVTVSTAGVAEFRQLAEHAATLFSARRQTITACTITADTATVSIDYAATLAQDIAGGPKAGSELLLQGESEFVLRHGKICHLIDRS